MRPFLCSIAIGLAVASVPAAKAETFFLKDGDVIEGTVVRALGKSLSIRLDRSGLQQTSLSAIDRVEMVVEGGGRITGKMGWWANGVYGLVTEQGLIEVRDGVVNRVTDSTPAPALTTAEGDADRNAVAPAPAAETLNSDQRSPKLEPTM